jgi:hypothetical protein
MGLQSEEKLVFADSFKRVHAKDADFSPSTNSGIGDTQITQKRICALFEFPLWHK